VPCNRSVGLLTFSPHLLTRVSQCPARVKNKATASASILALVNTIEQIAANPLPFAKLLGIEIVSASQDKVVAEMLVRDDICTRPAVLHGGAAMALADTLGAIATVLNLPAGTGTTTIESKTNFLAPAPAGSTVVAECTPIHRGKRTMVWQTRISTREGRLVALVTQTQLVI
jgi:1,4-dihydroxy-2-naphthoyl-CoA hydrolase